MRRCGIHGRGLATPRWLFESPSPNPTSRSIARLARGRRPCFSFERRFYDRANSGRCRLLLLGGFPSSRAQGQGVGLRIIVGAIFARLRHLRRPAVHPSSIRLRYPGHPVRWYGLMYLVGFVRSSARQYRALRIFTAGIRATSTTAAYGVFGVTGADGSGTCCSTSRLLSREPSRSSPCGRAA